MNPLDDDEDLRLICQQRRKDLREANLTGGDVEKAAKTFAQAFNAYQAAKGARIGIKAKPISAFHVMKNIESILAMTKDD
jgi:hypothetical protein